MILDGAKSDLSLENHDFDLRDIIMVVDHHIGLVVR